MFICTFFNASKGKSYCLVLAMDYDPSTDPFYSSSDTCWMVPGTVDPMN
jgi:hypothetical protein